MASESAKQQELEVLKPLIGFKGAVLDLDGTLLDAEPLYFEAYKHAANSYVCNPASEVILRPFTDFCSSSRFGKDYTVRFHSPSKCLARIDAAQLTFFNVMRCRIKHAQFV